MADITQTIVLQALKSVGDPDRGSNIVDLGMVAGLTLHNGHVALAIKVDHGRAPRLEGLRRAAERAIEALPGVLSVSAVLTAERSAAADASQHPAKLLAPGVRSIIAVASGKGGVGKSTTAANLALALSALGLKIGLLDADVYGPSQPRMMGITGRPSSPDGEHLLPMENYGVKVMSMGFMVASDAPIIWRGPMVSSAVSQMLSEVAWGDLDVLIADMPPGTGDIQLTMAQKVPLAGAVIVSTPQDIALLDARKGLEMFRNVDVPVLGIIENMSYFLCPHCGGRSDIFSHGGARSEAEKLGTDFLGEIPLDMSIRETSDSGHPIVVSQPASAHATSYRKIAERIWQKLSSGPQHRLPRIITQ